jgi:DinB family protein
LKELNEYREKLLKRLSEAAAEFHSACLSVLHPNDPVEPGGWSVHQLAVHTRDVELLVYGGRVRRALAENDPLFDNFDGDRYMTEHYDPHEPLSDVLDGFSGDVQELVRLLREMPVGGWSRLSRHETQGGGLTVQTWVERGLGHIEEHLKTVKKAQALAA